ncbi:MAG: ATP-binding protein, partial [Longimicrobiales bacterium]
DKREIIFELFRRDGIQQSDADGAGLGLPVSRQLARRLGGELTVDTVSGCGSRFRLALPHNDRPLLAAERTVPVLVAADAR